MKQHNPRNEITIFERSAADSTQGWGVTFTHYFLGQLHRCDPQSATEIGSAAFRHSDEIADINGRQVLYSGSVCYGISRRRLLDILIRRVQSLGVHIEFDHEVTTSAGLPPADLIVACDGANSRTRLEAGTFETDVRDGGNKYLWLGTDKVFDSFRTAFVHTDSGWIWAYCYGIGGDLSTFLVECSPATWAGLGLDRLSPQDGIPVLKRLFERQLDEHALLALPQQSASAGWLNFRTVTNRRWHDGNVVLAGDAAHTTHYTIGAGTTLAIGDAIDLARGLLYDGEQAQVLRSYERQRKAVVEKAQQAAQRSSRWFEGMHRYAGLEPREFATLMQGRTAALLPYLPPHLYYRLHQAKQGVPVLRKLGRRAGPKPKIVYLPPGPARPGDNPGDREHVMR
jgi:2-polyprenyl-6-methoxyphenol hydroxylase-like FAD-dependent oxidoreductase